MSNTSIKIPLTFNGILKTKPNKYERTILTFGYFLSCADLIRRVINIGVSSLINDPLSIFEGDDYLLIGETVAAALGPWVFPKENCISLEGDKFTLNRFGYSTYKVDLSDVVDFEENNINRRKQVITFQKKDGSLLEVPWFKFNRTHSQKDKKLVSSLFFEIKNRIAKNNNRIKA